MTPAMTLARFLSHVVGHLESAAIDYMIAGSIASSVYGEPRTTRDIDIVVEVENTALLALFDAFDRETIYIDEPAAGVLVGPGQMFNLIDLRGARRRCHARLCRRRAARQARMVGAIRVDSPTR